MQAAAERIWGAAQTNLRTMLTADIYNLWFEPLRAAELDGESIALEVANDFSEVWLKDNYMGLLQDVVAMASGKQLKVRFRVSPGAAADLSARAPAPTARHKSAEPATLPPPAPHEPQFNPKSTFESFVVGSNNNFAYAACQAVAQAPGKAYNPLFVYGGTGLGKTHLLHAIGQHVAHGRKTAKVSYVSSEKFTNEYIDALQNNQLVKFRKRFRHMDVLLIDDIQFLAGKERIQEEFFHTFNALHEAHKQIVLSCDRPANEIQGLEQRLMSRFEWGLVTDLQPPDVEMRLAILRKKAEIMGAKLPDEILSFLAHRIRSNVRRLEGALVRVASFASLTGQRVSVESVEGLLHEILHEEGRVSITIETIQKRVADHYDLRLSDMSSKRRPENIAFPRQIAMYLARQLTEHSLNTIGEAFGGRDHGTVLHACKQVKDRMEIDANVRQVVNHLEKLLLR